MKQYFLFLILCFGIISCGGLSGGQSAKTITEAEAAQGIRDALDKGVNRGITLLNKPDGFFGNPSYKLSIPKEAAQVELALRNFGMGALVDRTIIQVNRAAEEAVGSARPIFTEAIRDMSIPDAISIIRGSSDSATRYFKQKTSDKLAAAFMPIVKSTLEKFSATKYYGDMISTYNGFPSTTNKVSPDLAAYVTNAAINALFDQLSLEEANIRTHASARTTAAMKKAFAK